MMVPMDKPVTLPLGELPLIAATRVCLGVGIGLLISRNLRPQHCTTLGRALIAVGAITTAPLLVHVLSRAGAFDQQSQDTSAVRNQGRQRHLLSPHSSVW